MSETLTAGPRSPSLLCQVLDAAATRIVKNTSLATIEDRYLIECLLDLAQQFRSMPITPAKLDKDTPEAIISMALRLGLSEGASWWTGDTIDSEYADITSETQFIARATQDLLPELVTRYYMCKQVGPLKPRKKVGVSA